MENSLHHLLMANHLLFQKALLARLKDTGLTSGQPKVLDYLNHHNGAVQKEIATACHIEPATLTSILLGMEKKQLITRQMQNGNRRSLYVYLTDKGKNLAEHVALEFDKIEETAFAGFHKEDRESLIAFLTKIQQNMKYKGEIYHDKN